MKFFEGFVFVGNPDDPDSRECYWAEGHLSKVETVNHLHNVSGGKTDRKPSEVIHGWSEITEDDGTPDIAFCSSKEDKLHPDPITLVWK